MGNTYTQLFVQIVFGVLNRQPLINASWENNLYKYVNATIRDLGHKTLAINGMPDHLHIFVGLEPNLAISELVKSIKISSCKFVNENKYIGRQKFAWQSGYGAFSYAKDDVLNVCNYIRNQKEHHKTKTFEEEYRELLNEFDIAFSEKYLF